MARNKRPRKAYRPRSKDTDPMGLAMTTAAALLPRQVQAIMGMLHEALDAFRFGKAARHNWAELAARFQVGEALARAGIASDRVQAFADAQQVLIAVHQRAHGLQQSWTLRGPELAALDNAAFLHSVQLQHCSQGELARACDLVRRRGEQALAGNAGRNTTVLHVAPGAGAA